MSLRCRAEALQGWCEACLRALDMPAEDAQLLARSLVQTSLWGIDSHGVARLPDYLERLQRGSIKARPHIVVTRSGPCTAQVAGDAGQGIVVAHHANRVAMQLARENGIGAVGVSDSSHCGAMALYTRAAAQAGLIGLAFTHAGPVVAPYGGARPFLGTNPISIAVPRGAAAPVCLDMATTAIPWNRVINARREHEELPEGVALDAHGQPTTDAAAAQTVMSLGGVEYGYKGYGLALLIELLCGALHGNPSAPNIPTLFTELDAPSRRGAFFVVFDPLRFAGGPAFADAVAAMAAALAAPPGGPKMPGDPELAREAERRGSGIPIEPELMAQLRTWSNRLNLAEPGPTKT